MLINDIHKFKKSKFKALLCKVETYVDIQDLIYSRYSISVQGQQFECGVSNLLYVVKIHCKYNNESMKNSISVRYKNKLSIHKNYKRERRYFESAKSNIR